MTSPFIVLGEEDGAEMLLVPFLNVSLPIFGVRWPVGGVGFFLLAAIVIALIRAFFQAS